MNPTRRAASAPRRALAAAILLALGGTAGFVAADQFSTPEGVPRLITYEGSLTQNGTTVADGTHTLRFELFTVPSGGTNVWSNTESVDTRGGRFAVTLGDSPGGQAPIDLSDFATGDLYLEVAVQVGASTYEVLGRQRLTSAPYALRSATAYAASTATGALATELADLQARVPSSYFVSAVLTAGVPIALDTTAAAAATWTGVRFVQSPAFTANVDAASDAVRVACAPGTASTGTDCGAADEQVGVNFTAPGAGTYRVCATWEVEYGGAQGDVYWGLFETSDPGAVIAQPPKSREREQWGGFSGSNIAHTRTHDACEDLTYAAPGTHTIRLGYLVVNSPTYVNVEPRSASGGVRWTIVQVAR